LLSLPDEFKIPHALPLTEGKMHFIRKLDENSQVRILNVQWSVTQGHPGQGVWATLDIRQSGAKLRIYDAAPDATQRHCLAVHDFPLREPVVPLAPQFRRQQSTAQPQPQSAWHPAWYTVPMTLGTIFYDVVKVCSRVKVPNLSTML
jgi:hypothetical protein